MAKPSLRPLPDAPDPVLERPSKLKRWSHDLTKIIKTESAHLWDTWRFGPGSLTKADLTRTLKKITGCGSVVELRAAIDRNTGVMGPMAVHAANFCGQHTVCPNCAGRVQDRRGARFKAPIMAAAEKYEFAYMLTATMPPSETWREDLNQLTTAWKAFRKLGQKRGKGRDPGEFGKVRAGLAKIELKRGESSGLPHCHYHALVFTEERLNFQVWSKEEKRKPTDERIPLYAIPDESNPRGWVPASKLTYEWSRVTGFKARSFDVSPIEYREEDKRAGLSYEESVFRQSKEVLKYATKFDTNPTVGSEALFAADFVAIKDATYNRRLFHTYGDFFGVPGSDFVGGGPHLRDNPLIFESRWRENRYSDLVLRTKPVFMGTDKSLRNQERITKLNRVQGGVRRIRTGIIAAKNYYRETGKLRHAEVTTRIYLMEGGFSEKISILEIPSYVLGDPSNLDNWARWIDEAMSAGRIAYAALRESLDLASNERILGTKEERREANEAMRRAMFTAPDYDQSVVRCFMEILNPDPFGPFALSPFQADPYCFSMPPIPGPAGPSLDIEPLPRYIDYAV